MHPEFKSTFQSVLETVLEVTRAPESALPSAPTAAKSLVRADHSSGSALFPFVSFQLWCNLSDKHSCYFFSFPFFSLLEFKVSPLVFSALERLELSVVSFLVFAALVACFSPTFLGRFSLAPCWEFCRVTLYPLLCSPLILLVVSYLYREFSDPLSRCIWSLALRAVTLTLCPSGHPPPATPTLSVRTSQECGLLHQPRECKAFTSPLLF